MELYRLAFKELAVGHTELIDIALNMPTAHKTTVDLLWDLIDLVSMEMFVREFEGTRESAVRAYRANVARLED